MRLAIIGYGVVGKNIHKEFPLADIIDPAQGYPDNGERAGLDAPFLEAVVAENTRMRSRS